MSDWSGGKQRSGSLTVTPTTEGRRGATASSRFDVLGPLNSVWHTAIQPLSQLTQVLIEAMRNERCGAGSLSSHHVGRTRCVSMIPTQGAASAIYHLAGTNSKARSTRSWEWGALSQTDDD